MSETAGEKTFEPTPKKLRDAAQKGDVLRSKELATAATVLVGTAWLIMAGPGLFEGMLRLVRSSFMFDRGQLEQVGGLDIAAQLPGLFLPIMILGLLVSAASAVSQLAFGNGRWVVKNLAFKGSRINPLSGLKRMFGPNSWIEMGKGLLKVALLGTIAAIWAQGALEAISGLGRYSLSALLLQAWDALITLFAALTAGLVVIACIDLPIQWTRRSKRLKMSHQEMRDEHKQAEGSPEAKAHRRQRQRDIATGSVAGAMRDAQFVITNPTHFSVALTYDPAIASAPIVLAKGRGDKAFAIRELAAERQLPVLEYPDLARSIYYTTRERQVIREELYGAVAMIVAFVLSIRRGEAAPRPLVDVPVEMRFDAEGQPQTSPNPLNQAP